jgi:SAM-dependent methyltransferase
MKDRIELKDVVLLGRTFTEYCSYLQLEHHDLAAGRVLDMGAGIGSFCAEAAVRGYDVTAADPIYDLAQETIAEKSKADLEEVMRQLPEVSHKYNWAFYRDPGELRRYRDGARRIFLGDYSLGHKRYVRAVLPKTPFADKEFSLVLVSHFLFLYDDLFDYDFHKASVMELARIAQREIRIYPLINMRAIRSSYVEQLMHDPVCSALTFERLKSNFEFFKNADQLLIIRTE